MNAPRLWPQRGDTPVTAARSIALVYRTHLRAANPTGCDRIDEAMLHLGHRWVVPQLVTYDAGTLVVTAEAAVIAGVGQEAIRQWRKRGYIDREGVRRHLQVRGLGERGAPMFNVGEILEIAAITRGRRTGA